MKRESGVLLAISSLPSKYGIGCFDKAAYDFVDFLESAGQTYWQILPLGATSHSGAYDSPYQAYSAFAGSPYFISLEALIEEGVLTKAECSRACFAADPLKVDYEALSARRLPLLRKAYERSGIYEMSEYQSFIRENFWWLDDYALFMALKEHFKGVSWQDWPEDIRMHRPEAVAVYHKELYFDVEFHKYLQFKFDEQWSKLKKYANDKGIRILGDIPIYVSPDGSDVWANPELFRLDENNALAAIAGCPPDAFAPEGQVWGNPLYDWDKHRETGYRWWITRMWYSYKLYDTVRIDHFRGFDEFFVIPADTRLAKDGKWEKGPGIELFNILKRELGEKPVIAEDLGFMTDTVRQLVADSGYPNMKVIQFAFDPADEFGRDDHKPHNYRNNCVVYTGTHDNETLAGWFAHQSREIKDCIREYFADYKTPLRELPRLILIAALRSAADICIIPVQDWLGLDNSARMNTPGTVEINWSWRLADGALTPELAEDMLTLTKRYGRANVKPAAAEEAVDAVEEETEKASE